MKYIRPTLNLLTPAASAIRGNGNGVGCPNNSTKESLSTNDNFCSGGIYTSTVSAYEVDE